MWCFKKINTEKYKLKFKGILLEACVGCYKEAKKAELQGADRIELCDNLGEGGTTPSYGTIYLATQNINIPIAVIIRPRG